MSRPFLTADLHPNVALASTPRQARRLQWCATIKRRENAVQICWCEGWSRDGQKIIRLLENEQRPRRAGMGRTFFGHRHPERGSIQLSSCLRGICSLILGAALALLRIRLRNPNSPQIGYVSRYSRNGEPWVNCNHASRLHLGVSALIADGFIGIPEQPRVVSRLVEPLCAYTEVRIAEVTQLRKEDVCERDGIAYLRLTLEASNVKNGQYRDVPIHPHLLEPEHG